MENVILICTKFGISSTHAQSTVMLSGSAQRETRWVIWRIQPQDTERHSRLCSHVRVVVEAQVSETSKFLKVLRVTKNNLGSHSHMIKQGVFSGLNNKRVIM